MKEIEGAIGKEGIGRVLKGPRGTETQVSTEEEREQLRVDFEAAEDWLYEEGKELEEAAYIGKKRELEKTTAALFLRVSELELRPRVIEKAEAAVNWTLTLMETWVAERPEVTEEERTKVQGMCANLTEWLGEVVQKQQALPLHAEPAFLSEDVTAKLDPIEKEVRRLIRKPKPKPKKPSTNETAANASNRSNQTESADVNATDATDAASEEDGASGEELPAHDEL